MIAATVVTAEPAAPVTTAEPVTVEQPTAVVDAASTNPSVPEPEVPKFRTVKQLRLRSAAAYLPHVNKESYGGEDAHFISNISGGAIGVADGTLQLSSCSRVSLLIITESACLCQSVLSHRVRPNDASLGPVRSCGKHLAAGSPARTLLAHSSNCRTAAASHSKLTLHQQRAAY